jgi:hypothetical protein
MAFTDHCDVFASINESALRRVISHFTRQRPSLFNYGSAGVQQRPELLCRPIDAHPVAVARGDVLITALPSLPVVFTDNPPLQMDWCVQLSKAALDVHPGNAVALPPELDPLGEQRLAGQLAVCAGLGCPEEALRELVPRPQLSVGRGSPTDRFAVERRDDKPPRPDKPPLPPVTVPTRNLECFCLEADLVAGADFVGPAGDQHFRGIFGGLEIVDLAPQGMEDAIECYAKLVAIFGLLPKLSMPVIRFTTELLGLVALAIEPTPSSSDVPNNPALEDDSIKLFIDLTASSITGGGGGGSGGGSSPPSDPGSPRPRTRTGPFDVLAAGSERAVQELFDGIRDGAKLDEADSVDFGPFTAGYDVKAHLEGGTIDLRSNGTIALKELDIEWDVLHFFAGIDIPEICVGGFCIIPNPFGGCLVRAPRICVFSANPDLGINLDLSGLLVSEVSATIEPIIKYSVNPGRAPGMNDWDAHDASVPNHWQLYVDPVSIDLDVFDFADIVGNLLENALNTAIDTLLGPLPGWAKDLIRAILGPIIDVVRDILDIGDDIQEWLEQLLGTSLGLLNVILTFVADWLASSPIIEFPDPLPLLGAEPGKMAVLLPVEFLGVEVDDTELQLQVDVGD